MTTENRTNRERDLAPEVPGRTCLPRKSKQQFMRFLLNHCDHSSRVVVKVASRGAPPLWHCTDGGRWVRHWRDPVIWGKPVHN